MNPTVEPGDLVVPELCNIYDDIVRLWSEGDSVYAALAETAKQGLGELDCEAITR